MVPPGSTVWFGVPERQGESLRDPGGQSSSVIAQLGRLSTPPPPKKGRALPRVSQGVDTGGCSDPPGFPTAGIPSATPGRVLGGGGGILPGCVRKGRAGRKAPPPPPPRPHLGSPGGRGARAGAWLQRVWAASPRRPVGAARWAGRPPSDAGRKLPPGLPGTRSRAPGAGPGLGPAPKGRGQAGPTGTSSL